METVNKICVWIVVVLAVLAFVMAVMKKSVRNITDVTITDTIYNKMVLDSIEYDIALRDSEIVVLKRKAAYEKEQALAASDSDAVVQFKRLAASED